MSYPNTYQEVLEADLWVRPLEPGDVHTVLDIERQGYSHPWSESVFLDCFKDNYRLWGAFRGDVLTAYAVVTYMVDEAHLLNICVHPGARGKGVGRYLLRHVLATAAHEGLSQLLLEVRVSNHAAIALYEDEGFHEIGLRPGYYPAANGREDARVMMRALGQ